MLRVCARPQTSSAFAIYPSPPDQSSLVVCPPLLHAASIECGFTWRSIAVEGGTERGACCERHLGFTFRPGFELCHGEGNDPRRGYDAREPRCHQGTVPPSMDTVLFADDSNGQGSTLTAEFLEHLLQSSRCSSVDTSKYTAIRSNYCRLSHRTNQHWLPTAVRR